MKNTTQTVLGFMTDQQIILFSIFAVVFFLLLWGKFRYDLVAFSALIAGVITGAVPSNEAFSGFGHPATIIVALVLIVSAGLVRSGAVYLITNTCVDASRSISTHIVLMGFIGATISAFVNNVAALALLLPVDVQTAKKAGRTAGLSLMPLSFATILGGMATLVGTPPNIIISSFRERALGAPFEMFDFAPVGGIVALIGIIFVALVGWKLVPKRNEGGMSAKDIDLFISELTIPYGSSLAGKKLNELEDAASASDVALIGLIRANKRLYGSAQAATLEEQDALVIEASPNALDEFRTNLGLNFADAKREALLKAEGEGLTLNEVVVTERSRVNGKSVGNIGLTWRKGAVLIGISRNGKKIVTQLRQCILLPGDILLILSQKEKADDLIGWLDVLPLEDRGNKLTANNKTSLALGLFAVAIISSAFGLIYLPVALSLLVILYVAFGVLEIESLYDSIEWPIIVLLGSMIPLGMALEASGSTELLAQILLDITGSQPPWVVLLILMIVTMTLSDVLNNTATTIVAAPVAIHLSDELGVSADPFLMAVAISASAAFLTPIGHKNNTIILGPGGYRFSDYWRMGLPLEIIIVTVSVPLILVFWPL